MNAGPLAYASAFLSRNAQTYPEDQVHQLQELYRDFVHICGAALELNGKLIQSDQREYHEALRMSFKELVDSLSTILEEVPSSSEGGDGSSVSGCSKAKRSSVIVFTAISGSNGGSSTA